MAKKKKGGKKSGKSNKVSGSDFKGEAFITTFLSIVGFIIALLVWKDNDYVMFYAKQSLLVFIVFIVSSAVMIVPILGWIAGVVIYIIGVVLWILSWVYALSGKKKEVPIVGKYSDKFDF